MCKKNETTVSCRLCGLEFAKKNFEIKRNPNHYCSRECAVGYRKLNKAQTKIECDECGSEFTKADKEIKRSQTHFCSRACNATYHKKPRNKVPCSSCSSPLEREPHVVKRNGGKAFCSPSCQTNYNYEQYVSSWKDGGELGFTGKNYHLSGYVYRYIKERDICCVECGQDSSWNGKELTLHVDHIDGRASNCTPDNLRLLCPHCHSQTETYGSKNINSDRKR